MRIVILGETGVGKSSSANTIFGEELFQIVHSGISATSECGSETRRVDGRDVTLIDTPGLFDTDRPEEELKAAIVKCITECAPGPHAFLIVFKVARFTDQEQEVINKIKEYFSDEAFKYATLVFTHGDQLEEGQTIEEYFCNNHLMSDLMKQCGGRCHVVDNKYWKNQQPDEYRSNQFQVKQLLKTIDHMIEANKGSCYTNEMLQAVEALIQEEEEEIRQSPGDKIKEKIMVKKTVNRKRWIKFAGISTGVLLGGLLGGALVSGVVLKVLKKHLSDEKVKRVLAASAVGVARAATVAGVGVVGAVVGAEAAVITAGVVFSAAAIGGAIGGGLTGYEIAKEADTAGEAAKRTADTVINKVTSVFKNQKTAAKNKSESNPLNSTDSENVSLKMSTVAINLK